MAGMHQDTYVTGQSVAMFIQDLLDVEELPAAVSGASLASSQEHGPPCHQPSMDNNQMEALSQESPIIILSKPMTLLKAYQMKLVIQKMKNPKEKVQQLIQTMMSMDDKLYIDPFYTDTPKLVMLSWFWLTFPWRTNILPSISSTCMILATRKA
jgi:hypothetical protein